MYTKTITIYTPYVHKYKDNNKVIQMFILNEV